MNYVKLFIPEVDGIVLKTGDDIDFQDEEIFGGGYLSDEEREYIVTEGYNPKYGKVIKIPEEDYNTGNY